MSPPTEGNQVSSSLSQLSLGDNKENSKPKPKPTKKKAKEVVADSWEDEDISESETDSTKVHEEEESAPQRAITPTTTSTRSDVPFDSPWPSAAGSASSRNTDPGKRPEKTDAVARRMIAAGLGLKAPKLTEEQKAFQKSVKEQEKKKRELEKLQEQKRREDGEKAKAAIWDD